MSVPADIERILRQRGAVIDVAGTRALYEPLLANLPRQGVRRELDRAYGSDARHRMDIYAPEPAPAGLLPAFVFVHGGGFVRGDKADRHNIGFTLAREGWLTVLPTYRLGPDHRWPAGAEDVSRVLEWLADHAAELGVDPRRVIVAGESAGAAHVAAALLVRRLQPRPAAMPAGAALISGVYNARLEALARAQFGIATPDPRNEAYFGPEPAEWDRMSTVDLVDASAFPLLVTYAELDPPQMQVQAGELFARLVCRHGFQPALQVVRGHDHLSQLYSIGTGDGSLLDVLRRWAARVLEGTATAVV